MTAVATLVLPRIDSQFRSMKSVVPAQDFLVAAFGASGGHRLDIGHDFDFGLSGLLGHPQRGVPFGDHHAAVADERLTRHEIGSDK